MKGAVLSLIRYVNAKSGNPIMRVWGKSPKYLVRVPMAPIVVTTVKRVATVYVVFMGIDVKVPLAFGMAEMTKMYRRMLCGSSPWPALRRRKIYNYRQ